MSYPPPAPIYDDIENGLDATVTLLSDQERFSASSHELPYFHPEKTSWLERLQDALQDKFESRKRRASWRELLLAFSATSVLALLLFFAIAVRPNNETQAVDIRIITNSSYLLSPLVLAGLRYNAFNMSDLRLDSTQHPVEATSLSIKSLGLLLDPPKSLFWNTKHTGLFAPPKFDVVWTWVNGSDPVHHVAITKAESQLMKHQRQLLNTRSSIHHSDRSYEPTIAEVAAAVMRRQTMSPKLYR
jgi:hypothetical protein